MGVSRSDTSWALCVYSPTLTIWSQKRYSDEHADAAGEDPRQDDEAPPLQAFLGFHQVPSLSACLNTLNRLSRAKRNGAITPL